MVSSEYAAFSSVRPIKLKSMIPFSGCTYRHSSVTDCEVVVIGTSVVVEAGVPIEASQMYNMICRILIYLNKHSNKHIYL